MAVTSQSLKPQQVISQTARFGWDPVSYEIFRKTPAGIAQDTNIRLRAAEWLYGEEEAQRINQWLFEKEYYPNEDYLEEESTSTNESQAFWLDDRNKSNLLNGGANKLTTDRQALKDLINQANNTLRRSRSYQSYLTNYISASDENTKWHSNKNKKNLEKSLSQKQGNRYLISEAEYKEATQSFEQASQSQAEKLAALQQKEANAWHLEQQASEIRTKVDSLQRGLERLPLNHSDRPAILNEVRMGEMAADAHEREAASIREQIATEREAVNRTMENIRTDEARWDMSAAQSGVGVAPREHYMQVSRREDMLLELQRRTSQGALRAAREAREEASQQQEQGRTPVDTQPAQEVQSHPGHTLREIDRENRRHQQFEAAARRAWAWTPNKDMSVVAPPMTKKQAMRVLGISSQQWDSLPADVPFDQRKDSGEPEKDKIQDKMDLLMDAQISKSQEYSNYDIPSNRVNQNQVMKAYHVLTQEIEREEAKIAAGIASPVPPQEETPSQVPPQEEIVPAASIVAPVAPVTATSAVNAAPQPQLRPQADTPAFQRRFDDGERQAIAATIDQNPAVREAFYNGTVSENRMLVAEEYQKAIQQRDEAAATLAHVQANPSRSSALANQQDVDYYNSVKQEADNRVNNLATLANYYGVETSQSTPVQNAVQPEPVPSQDAPLNQTQPVQQAGVVGTSSQQQSTPVTNAEPQTSQQLRDARLKRFAQPKAAQQAEVGGALSQPTPVAASTGSQPEKNRIVEMQDARPKPAETANTSLSVRSTAALNPESPQEREQRFSNMVIGGERGIVTPNSDGNGYTVAFGENAVLKVTEDAQTGMMSSEMVYDKELVSPDDVSGALASSCESAGVEAQSAIQVAGEEKESVKEAIINEAITNEKNVIQAQETEQVSAEESTRSPWDLSRPSPDNSNSNKSTEEEDEENEMSRTPSPSLAPSGGG